VSIKNPEAVELASGFLIDIKGEMGVCDLPRGRTIFYGALCCPEVEELKGANMAVSSKSRPMLMIRSPFGVVRVPRKMMPLLRVGAIGLFVLSVIAVWQLVVVIGQYPSFILPAPREVALELGNILPTPAFWGHVATT